MIKYLGAKTLTTTVFALSRPILAPPHFGDTYSLSIAATKNSFKPMQLWMLFRIHRRRHINHILLLIQAFHRCIFSIFCSCFSPVITQKITVPFVTMNRPLKFSDGLNHWHTDEQELHKIDAHMIPTSGKQPLAPVVYNQSQRRKWHIYMAISLERL